MRSAIKLICALALVIAVVVSIQTLIHLRSDPEVRTALADPDRPPGAPAPAGDPAYRERILAAQLGTGLALLLSCGAVVLLGMSWQRSANADSPEVRDERRQRTVTYERLRERDRRATLARLASSVSHSLGTPLNVISGRAQLITAGLSDDEARSSARTIHDQTRKLVEIVATVAAYAHQRKPERGRHGMADVLGEAAALIEPMTDSVALAVAVDDDLEADLDRGAAVQLVTALAARAIEAMPSGGAVTLAAEVIAVESPPDKRCPAGRYLRLTVEDDGPALADDPRHIFDPIAKPSGRDANPIIGLAPYICKAIAREHGGWIEVVPRDGGGTRFDAWLRQGGAP
jgi:two-component system, NtrC family, sensor kinase